MGKLVDIFKLYTKRKIFVAVLFIFIITISKLNVYSKTVLGDIVDNITVKDKFMNFIVLFVVVNVALYLINLLYSVVQKSFSFKIINELKLQLANKIIKMNFESFNKYDHDNIFQMWNKDVDELQNMSFETFFNYAMIILSAIFAITEFVKISIWIPCIAVLINLIGMYPIVLLTNRAKKAWKHLRDSEVNMNGKFSGLFDTIRLIKAFGKEEHAMVEFESCNEVFVDKQIDAMIVNRLHKSLISVIDTLAQVVILLFGSFSVMKGQMSIGDILVAITLLPILNQPFSETGRMLANLKALGVKIDNLLKFLSEEDEHLKGEAIELQEDYELSFENVGYSINDQSLVCNLNFKVRKGEKIGIVGESGSGKTTLNNLLLRLYEPTEGRIMLNGVDILTCNIKSYRKNIHYSQSNTYLINDTIYNNLTLLGASKDEVTQVAKDIGFHDEICNMESGYNTVISPNASNVSGGQKKRLEIIRAITNKKNIYIFDEITKGIDNETAHAIMMYILDRIKETMFITMHEMYGIKKLDKILVMKNGRILSVGNHEELLASCDYYNRLYNNDKRSDEDGIS